LTANHGEAKANSRLFEESEEFLRSLNHKHKVWEQKPDEDGDSALSYCEGEVADEA